MENQVQTIDQQQDPNDYQQLQQYMTKSYNFSQYFSQDYGSTVNSGVDFEQFIPYEHFPSPLKKVTHRITQKYSKDKLMMMLDKRKLEALEEEFRDHPDGIKLGSFVWLMKASINHLEEDRYSIVYGLQKLFAEIDMNGDEQMEWAEFTQYIIDAVISNPATKHSKSKDLLQETKMMKFKKFFPSKIKDKNSHGQFIKNAVWCPKFQSLMLLEHNSKQIKMLTQDLQHKFSLKLPVSIKEVYIIDIDYSNEHQTFGCIDSDSNILFWEYYISIKQTKTIKSPSLLSKLKYLKNHKTWITVGMDFVIREYDLKKETPLILQVAGHKKHILDVIELDYPFGIASASLDHTIRLYSLVDNEHISTLTEHQKGVRKLSYNPNFGGYIISVAFEREIYVWSPEVTQNKSLIGKLQGHTEIVVCAKFLHTTPFCLSIDDKFNLRFWDVRSLTCVQVLTNETNAQVPCYGIMQFPFKEQFVVISKRLLFFDTEKKEGMQNSNQNQQQSQQKQDDAVIPFRAMFNYYYLNFVVVTSQDVRIYNAKDGKLQKIIQDIQDPKTRASITSFCMDEIQRKFYVGDQMGAIRSYNISNGVLIKNIQPAYSITTANKRMFQQQQQNNKKQSIQALVAGMDSHEISQLQYVHLENHATQLLISTAWDSSLKIHNEELQEEAPLIRHSVGGHVREDISCMAVCKDLSLIATGSSSGVIAIWDFESNKLESMCISHNKAISSLKFLYPYPMLVSTSNDGLACIWGVKPCPLLYRYKLLKIIKNNCDDEDFCVNSSNITCSATKFIKDHSTQYRSVPIMVLGDDLGYIYKWSLDKVITEFVGKGFTESQSICKFKLSYNPRKNAEVNALANAKNLFYFAEEKKSSSVGADIAINSTNYAKILQVRAHQDSVSSVEYISNPDGIVTSAGGIDRHVKIWAMDGTLWGDINLMNEKFDKQWKYPFDWSEKKEQEIQQLKQLMKVVEGNDSKLAQDDVIFDLNYKKHKSTSEKIDYLAKRSRRQQIEEQQKRERERKEEQDNQDLITAKASYVSKQALKDEQNFQETFKQDIKRAEERIYSKKHVLNGYPVHLGKELDKKIQEKEQETRLMLQQQNEQLDPDNNHNVSNSQMTHFVGTKNSLAFSRMETTQKRQRRMVLKKNLKDVNKEFNQKLLGNQNFMNTFNSGSRQGARPNSTLNFYSQSTQKDQFIMSPPMSPQIQHFEPPKLSRNTVSYNTNMNLYSNNTENYKPLVSPKQIKSAMQSIKSHISSPKQSPSLLNQKYNRPLFASESQPLLGMRGKGGGGGGTISRYEGTLLDSIRAPQQPYQYQREHERLSEIARDLNLFPNDDMNVQGQQNNLDEGAKTTKERRCLIGIEGVGPRLSNGKFLRRLNNFIGTVGPTRSKLNDRVSNVRYASGEGVRILKATQNKLGQTQVIVKKPIIKESVFD